MPSVAEARSRWETTLKHCSTLADLQRAVRYSSADGPAARACRSLCWKIFLLFGNVSPTAWIHSLGEARTSYTETRDHLLRFIRHPETLASLSSDPLTDDPNSPWNSARHDEAIRAEIEQDVRRLPDEPFYHQEHIQGMIIDILFVYCKLNPSVGGYRQGMHELLAPILYVVEHDAVEAEAEVSETDKLMLQVLDRSFAEHDAFALFSRLMDRAAPFYEVKHTPGSTLSPDAQDSGSSVIVEKSRFIHEVYLNKVDPELSRHLTDIDVLPQIFLIRWIRLLFGREFPFDELLLFWDTLFAVDPRLELVDLICVAMLLRIRWELLEADYSVCLQLLLKYPIPAPPHGPNTFVDDALYLRDHLNHSGATALLMKYTGRVPSAAHSGDPAPDARPVSPGSRTLGALRARAMSPRASLPTRLIQQPGGVEALLQVAAKNVRERGEKLGINQAVREAVGEIRRNVQSLQETRPYAARSVRETLAAGGSGLVAPEEAALAMERRNRLLAGMLEESLSGLKAATAEGLEDRAKCLEMIEIAASKMQLVKVYLEDPSVDIPEPGSVGQVTGNSDVDAVMESTPEAEAEQRTEVGAEESLTKSGSAVVPDPVPAISSLSLTDENVRPPRPREPTAVPTPSSPSRSPAEPRRPNPLPSRSSIAQSSFAWMLEPERETTRPSASNREFSPSPTGSPRRGYASRGKNAFLFGEVVPSGDKAGGDGREIFGMEDVERKGGERGGLFG